MTGYYSGQLITYWEQIKRNPTNLKPIDATFLSYSGRVSAQISIAGVIKRVRLDSIEPAKTKPALLRAGSFVA